MGMSINEFKENISILEFIKYKKLDFILKRDAKNVRAFVPFRNSDNTIVYHQNKAAKKTKLIISRINKVDNLGTELKDNNGNTLPYEVYRDENSFDQKNTKSIIDFVHEHVLHNTGKITDFKQIFGILNDYVNSKEFIHIKNSTIDILSAHRKQKQQSDPKAVRKLYTIVNADTLAYLKSRKITSKTYSSKYFIGSYGTYFDPNGKYGTKPAFPLFNQQHQLNTLQWIDFDGQKHNGKYFLENINRGESVYLSNTDKYLNSNVSIIMESPEKNMAHYELFGESLVKQNLEPLYFASCGQLTHDILDTITYISNEKEIDRFITAFDNDIKGVQYTFATALHINLESPNYSLSVLPDQHNDKLINISIQSEDINELKNLFSTTTIKFKAENNKLVISDSIDNLMSSIKFPNMITHQAISKDFLDDLSNNEKLPKSFKFEKENNIKTKSELQL